MKDDFVLAIIFMLTGTNSFFIYGMHDIELLSAVSFLNIMLAIAYGIKGIYFQEVEE